MLGFMLGPHNIGWMKRVEVEKNPLAAAITTRESNASCGPSGMRSWGKNITGLRIIRGNLFRPTLPLHWNKSMMDSFR